MQKMFISWTYFIQVINLKAAAKISWKATRYQFSFATPMFLQILEILWKGYCLVDHALLPEKQFSPQKSGNLIQTSFFTLLSFLLENLKEKNCGWGE
jgi:hypothetical protein